MPGRKVHNLFGTGLGLPRWVVDSVNADIDGPARELGPAHRKVNHDIAFAVSNSTTNPKYRGHEGQAFLAHVAHYEVDGATRDPNVRRALQIMEVLLP